MKTEEVFAIVLRSVDLVILVPATPDVLSHEVKAATIEIEQTPGNKHAPSMHTGVGGA